MMRGAEMEITELYGGRPTPVEVQVTFSMPYRGWCQLEASPEWDQLLDKLEDAQKRPEKL